MRKVRNFTSNNNPKNIFHFLRKFNITEPLTLRSEEPTQKEASSSTYSKYFIIKLEIEP